MSDVPSALLAGWQALEGVARFESGGRFEFLSSEDGAAERTWALPCVLSLSVEPTAHVPRETRWFVLVSPRYPCGEISLVPALEGGIAVTFQHQLYNGRVVAEKRWRSGKLCLESGERAVDRRAHNPEEIRTARGRLRWHVERALAWIDDAAAGTLVLAGDPFELPSLPSSDAAPRIAFQESAESLREWLATDARFGLVLLRRAAANLFAVTEFQDGDGRTLRANASSPESCDESLHGVWMRVNSTPVQAPWQAPRTWGELRDVCRHLGTDLDTVLLRIGDSLRDGAHHFLLVGFPIPDVIGGAAEALHWLGLYLPRLTRPGEKGLSRSTARVLAQRDRVTVLGDGVSLRWVEGQNLAPDELARRGSWGDGLRNRRTLLLGGGCVGSIAAEILARGGVQSFCVLDAQRLEVGNLVRHTLSLHDVGFQKAERLAMRLSSLSPLAHATAAIGEFPVALAQVGEGGLKTFDLILDCTANDDVLRELRGFDWAEDALMASLAISAGAKRLYCYVARAAAFDDEHFWRELDQWWSRDAAEGAGVSEIREGRGCYDSVFAGRYDEISGLVASAIGWLDWVTTENSALPQLVVLEWARDDQGVPLIRRASNR